MAEADHAMFCDLHMHSTASDGTHAPAELARLALAAGLGAIALTDHDTTAGLPACAAACAESGVAFVPGIELSADPGAIWTDIGQAPPERLGTLHILGYFIRHDEPGLQAIHRRLLDARAQRNPRIIANLQALGVEIAYDDVLELARAEGSRVVGRPHIAQVLLKKGYVKSIQDAFARYIGEGKAAYARTDLLPPREAIEAIHGTGGLASMAHPVQLRCHDDAAMDRAVVCLRSWGLDALETRHTDHTPAQVDRYGKLAARLGLLTTGGSDFHGERKPIGLGNQRVPMEVLDRLRAAAKAGG
ncbi:MAG: PHP domain-containing protein [Planctomycetota bacterium]|nr:PHP domain-containing protein [Planctomycetota bacterium]